MALPEVKNKPVPVEHFPTIMQAFIFRNWNMVAKEKLAEVLCTGVENVIIEARRLGLGAQGNTDIWKEKGYITIIRSNWHLLPYEQLLLLLDWDEKQLERVLKEEDFLGIKLGGFKPYCERVVYKELTAEQKKRTECISNTVEKNVCRHRKDNYFDFWNQGKENTYDTERLSTGFAESMYGKANLRTYHTQKTETEKREKDSARISESAFAKARNIFNFTGDDVVTVMAERFAEHICRDWNISVELQNIGIITLYYKDGEPEEYHQIEIAPDHIKITAGGSAGILRAFYRLEDMYRENGNLHLPSGSYERRPRFDIRFIYPFCALYESAFDVDSCSYCPDELLEKYAEAGINGIWLQGILYRLIEFPFGVEYSEGWQQRQKNLRSFVQRAWSYGIKIYLYLNEPRNMPSTFFEKHPEMRGASKGNYESMCLSSKEVQEYLRDGVESLCRAVPGLGGFFTITMSENMTHCKSVRDVEKMCPACASKSPWKLVAMVNSLIAEGAHRVSPKIKVIAWDWQWVEDYGFAEGDVEHCIKAMPKDVVIMCKRETKLPYIRGGVSGEVVDYTLSVEGMSAYSQEIWKRAQKYHHDTAVKLQVNTTWECSTVPYLPIYRTLTHMMDDVIAQNINHLMLSWTLGGYPSPAIRVLSEAFFVENEKEKPNYQKGIKAIYGLHAQVVCQATDIFCEAFREFPFDLSVLYQGPQNGGVSNLLYNKPTGYKATMTCYAYDDLESWCYSYPADILEEQFRLLSEKWELGLQILEQEINIQSVGAAVKELYAMAYAGYSLFRSSYHQIRYIRLRDAVETIENSACKNQSVSLDVQDDMGNAQENLKQIRSILRAELDLAEKVYGILCEYPQIGFEAANHYYYTSDTVLEKMINCQYLLDIRYA